MHKRSLMGILEGLKGLKILFEEDGIYYPGWIEEGNRFKREQPTRSREESYEVPPKKKAHLERSQKKNLKQKEEKAKKEQAIAYRKIS